MTTDSSNGSSNNLNSQNASVSPVYGMLIQAQESHLDVWGHVNNVCFVQWMQDIAVAHSDVLGWGAQRYLDFGAIWVVRSHTIDYRRSAYLGNKILAQTWIAEMKRASCLRRYRFLLLPEDVTETEIQNATGFASYDKFDFPQSALMATAETHWAFVSTKTLRPINVHEELYDDFARPIERSAVFPRFEGAVK